MRNGFAMTELDGSFVSSQRLPSLQFSAIMLYGKERRDVLRGSIVARLVRCSDVSGAMMRKIKWSANAWCRFLVRLSEYPTSSSYGYLSFVSLSVFFSIYRPMCMFSACFPVLLSVCMLHQQTDGQKDCHTISSICSSVCSSLCFFFSPVSNIGNICKFLRFTYRKNNVGLTFRILQNM